jgi:hydroxyacylglutathione hydrolase
VGPWSEGIHLLGTYGSLDTGCWLLEHGGVGAVVEMPPYARDRAAPVADAVGEAGRMGIRVEHLLCTHMHGDHFAIETVLEFLMNFREAGLLLQRGFQAFLKKRLPGRLRYFDESAELDLGGEPLYLVHAPKHSWTDTIVIFRGAAIMGDWELDTIRSVHDGKPHAVPVARRLESIESLLAFTREHGYRIHKTFSAHANEKREDLDFAALMESTKEDRRLF